MSKLHDKIKALLNKTTSNGCTEAEALAALALAQRLMDEYEIQTTVRNPRSFSMTKTLVVIESPFAGATDELRAENLHFARRALRDSILRGESPIASHLLYTQDSVLRDYCPEERALGIECGLAWLSVADRHVFYTDRGWSLGMLGALYESPRFFHYVRLRGLDFPPRLPPAEVIAELPKDFFTLDNKE